LLQAKEKKKSNEMKKKKTVDEMIKKTVRNDTPLFEEERYKMLVENLNIALARMQQIGNEIDAERAERKSYGQAWFGQFKPTRKKRGTK
jgi:hypothetical protein